MGKESFDPTPDKCEHIVPVDLATMTALEDSRPAMTGRQLPDGSAVFHREPVRVNLEVDLSPASCLPGYAARRLDDVDLNTTPQRVALKLLTATLTRHRAELIDGTRITRPQQSVQWLLEQLAIRLPSPLLDQLMDGVE